MDHENEEDTGFNEHQAKVLAFARMISGSLSLIASTAMIIIIAKSTKRFTTTQNRFLLGLSLTNVIFSMTTSLTSMPAPKGTPNIWKPLGNQMTCDVQGFLQVFGVFSTPLYNCALCTFFLLKIRYKINDETMRTKVEPIFHIIALVIPLSLSTYALLKEYYNPYAGTCYLSDYPSGCSKSDTTPCERGENMLKDGFITFCCTLYGLVPGIIFGTMLTMFITVQQQEARMARFGIGSLQLSSSPRGIQRQATRTKSRYVRIVMHRAFAYSGAWLITFIFPTILAIHLDGSAPDSNSFTLAVLMSIFHPMQGFFNFLVFIYPKIHVMRQGDPNCSLCQLLSSLWHLSDERGEQQRPKNSMIIRSVQEIIDAGDDDMLKIDTCNDKDEKQDMNNIEENTSRVMGLQNIHDIQLADVFAPQTASLTPTQQEEYHLRVNDESDIVVSEEEKIEIR